MRHRLILSLIFCLIGLSNANAQEENPGQMPPPISTSCMIHQEWTGRDVKTIDLGMLSNTPYRIIHPDSMVTMDYSASRLNIMVDKNGIIIKQECG